jgi:ketosteroid isomerase-like protein
VSEDNVQLVRRALDAFNRRDIEYVLAALDDDIELYPSEDFPEGGPFRGREGLRQLFGLLGDAFEDLKIEPEDVVDAGDKVVMLIHQSGRGRTSRALVDNRYTLVFALRDGLAVRIDGYRDHAAALADAGRGQSAAGEDGPTPS